MTDVEPCPGCDRPMALSATHPLFGQTWRCEYPDCMAFSPEGGATDE